MWMLFQVTRSNQLRASSTPPAKAASRPASVSWMSARALVLPHESERLSPHGLRAGFITEAYLQGAADEQVQAHVRHADLRSTRGYRRRAKITTDNPARLLKL